MNRIACWIFISTQLVIARADDANLARRCELIQSVPNWRFVTPEFLAEIDSRQSDYVGTPVTVLGNVTNESGRPVPDALVLMRVQSNDSSVPKHNGITRDVFAATWTDSTGVYKFRDQPTPWREPLKRLRWEMAILAPD